MPTIGPLELILVILVVLLLFGSTKLPKLARSIGEASKEFKKGVHEPGDARTADPAAAAGRDGSGDDDRVTMSKAELDALLAERETRARKDTPPTA